VKGSKKKPASAGQLSLALAIDRGVLAWEQNRSICRAEAGRCGGRLEWRDVSIDAVTE
jgi:hypothetical protein